MEEHDENRLNEIEEDERELIDQSGYHQPEMLEGESGTRKISRRKAVVIGTIVFGGVLIAGMGFWAFFSGGKSGQPVAAPRTVDFSTSSDSVPEGEQVIELTDEQRENAGIEIVDVGETLDSVAANASTTGIVRANDYADTPVMSQTSGVVRSVNARLGEFIRRGSTIATISSDEVATAQANYLKSRAALGEAQARYKRSLNLSKISEESKGALDKARANSLANEARYEEAKANYERMKRLWEVGARSQRDVESAYAKMSEEDAKRTESMNRFDRSKQLLAVNPARKNEIDLYMAEVRKKEAELAAERQKLLVLGVSANRVNSLRSARQISSLLAIAAPVSGTVTERIANPGEVVSSNGKIAVVANLSSVWVIAQVYEKDLAKLALGTGASVTTDSYPGELFRGQISYIDPSLDERTRTAQVRIELPNPGNRLKMGMYVSVAFARIGGSERTAPLIPKEAVQKIGNGDYVFLATDNANKFIVRPVKLGEEKNGSYPVLEGVFVGDRIVVEGSFLLRAEWIKLNPTS